MFRAGSEIDRDSPGSEPSLTSATSRGCRNIGLSGGF